MSGRGAELVKAAQEKRIEQDALLIAALRSQRDELAEALRGLCNAAHLVAVEGYSKGQLPLHAAIVGAENLLAKVTP